MPGDGKTIHTSGTDSPSIPATLQSRVSDIVEWTHLNHRSLNPTKTNNMILTTRQKRQTLNSSPAHILIGNQQLHRVSGHTLLGVTIDINLTRGPQIRDLCKSAGKKKKKKPKRFISQQKIRTFSPILLKKHSFKPIFNFVWNMLQLFGILQVSLYKRF